MNSIAQIESQAPAATSDGDDSQFSLRYPLRILVADGNYISRRSLTLILQHLGYEPSMAESGHEFLDTAKLRSHDMVLLDIDDPEMEAIDHAKQAREGKIDMPIVAVTSYSPNIVRMDCAPADVNGYLTKPLNLGDVKQALRESYINAHHFR